jgi:hypothetical protein
MSGALHPRCARRACARSRGRPTVPPAFDGLPRPCSSDRHRSESIPKTSNCLPSLAAKVLVVEKSVFLHRGVRLRHELVRVDPARFDARSCERRCLHPRMVSDSYESMATAIHQEFGHVIGIMTEDPNDLKVGALLGQGTNSQALSREHGASCVYQTDRATLRERQRRCSRGALNLPRPTHSLSATP